jgi:hypothetical protein
MPLAPGTLQLHAYQNGTTAVFDMRAECLAHAPQLAVAAGQGIQLEDWGTYEATRGGRA